MGIHIIFLSEENGLPFEDSSKVCYHEWELTSDNEESKYEVFLKCKKCGKIINWASGG